MTKLEELKAAYEAATPGEWVTGKGGTAYYPLQIRCVSSDWDSLIAAFHSWDAQKESNANFIALAHNLMPQLLEAVETLRAIRARYEGEFDNKALMDKGALLTDPCEDMYTFAKDYLEKLK